MITAYMWNLKFKNDANKLIYKTETDTDIRKEMYGYQRGRLKGRDKLGVYG